MKRFLVARLLLRNAVHYPQPYSLGQVEVRPAGYDTPAEREALRESLSHYSGQALLEVSNRVVTICSGDSADEADWDASDIFAEALDAISLTSFGVSYIRCSEAGYVRDLESGLITPMKPTGLQASPSFMMDHEHYAPMDLAQALCGGAAETELTQRLKKSARWSRRAAWDGSIQIRCLSRWVAMEAVWKLQRDDDISSKILWALGFPPKRFAAWTTMAIRPALEALPTYVSWRSRLRDLVNRMRLYRHNSVHEGYGETDVTKDDLVLFDAVTTLACARVQRHVIAGIHAGLQTIRELHDHLPTLFDTPETLHDIRGAVLYTLDNQRGRTHTRRARGV